MKVMFLGTPAFAVPVLDGIVASGHHVVAVVTQPDRANARGKKIVDSPVKARAIQLGLPILQYDRISDHAAELRAYGADIMITAAYGQILSDEILTLTPHGVVNVHASLLPRYRGASPVQWALMAGEREVGVTFMQTVKEVDAGDILDTASVVLNGTENAAETLALLAEVAGKQIGALLDRLAEGAIVPRPQDHTLATHCRKLSKEDGHILFDCSAEATVNRIRGVSPDPSAYTMLPTGRLKILSAELADGTGSAGEVLGQDKRGLIVACRSGAVRLLRVQGEGGKAMPAPDYLRGKPIPAGTILK